MKSPYDPLLGSPGAPLLDQLDMIRRATSAMELQRLYSPEHSAVGDVLKQLDTSALLGITNSTSRLTDAARDILSPLDQISAGMTSARRIHEAFGINSVTSRLAEAARGLAGQLDQISLSVSSARQLHDTIESVRANARMFEDQFRVANSFDLASISEMLNVAQSSYGIAKYVKAIEPFRTISLPIINLEDSLRSARAIAELSTIGTAVNIAPPFNPAFVKALRVDLGDWREAIIDPTAMLDDPAARIAAYVDRGFNAELTDFPAQSFDAAITVTNIRLGAARAYLELPPSEGVPQQNREGYDWLYILETQLRAFIISRLRAVHDRWEQRLPKGMHDKWQDKKAKDIAEGRPEQPIIHYADFTDYNDIILASANWRDCFKDAFKREEAVREGFNRLRPIRLVVAHMRVLTSEEHLLLNVEVRRLLRAIGSPPSPTSKL